MLGEQSIFLNKITYCHWLDGRHEWCAIAAMENQRL